jgi:hypothetical protein
MTNGITWNLHQWQGKPIVREKRLTKFNREKLKRQLNNIIAKTSR